MSCSDTFRMSLLLTSLLICLATATMAQPTNGPKHSLWEVVNGTNQIYLFGTIHFSSSNFFPLPTVVEKAFARSDTILLESDHEGESSSIGYSKMLAASQYPPGDNLKNHLSPQVYSNVQAYLIHAGIQPSRLDDSRAFMVAFTLLDYGTRERGLDMSQSVDRYLWRQATRENKRVVPLDSVDQKLKLLTDLNDNQQEYLVAESLREIATTNRILQDVALAWTRGETDKIDKFIFDFLLKDPDFGKIFVTDRNKRWMPSIEAEIKRGENLFIVVGLGHLLGKESLVDLLSKRGYKVRQL